VALAVAAGGAALAGHAMVALRLVPAGARPAHEPAAESALAHRGTLMLLIAIVAVNGFLIDGFSVLFPETVRTHSTLALEDQTVNMLVLAVGGVGQWVGGLLARGRSEVRRYAIMLACQPAAMLSVGLLLGRPSAAFAGMAVFAFSNYMTQPVENRLLAGATSTARRSTAYAMKFLVSLLAGALAPRVVVPLATTQGHAASYVLLAGCSLAGAALGLAFLRSAAARGAAGRTAAA